MDMGGEAFVGFLPPLFSTERYLKVLYLIIIMERITIYPDKQLKGKLDNEAKEEGRSLNNLILFILNKFFKNENRHNKPNRKRP